ncbi:MAG: hypothetical protein IPM52_02600 [Bacteroidetes bacterium]|nr:hypothetical protein [Bacteroidota bacterium]
MRIILIVINLGCVFILPTFAQVDQVKMEREVRISRSVFPERAINQLAAIENEISLVRYFKEFNESDTSYEAKFEWKGHRWSMEFDKNGRFEDLEKSLPLKSFISKMGKTMRSELESLGKHYRILEAQQQYSWAIQDGRDFEPTMIQPGHKGVVIRYELEVEVKKAGSPVVTYELTFDEEGRLLSRREVAPYSDTHILH